jgi:hypothetical protein
MRSFLAGIAIVVLIQSPAVAQDWSQDVADAMNDLRRCMSNTIVDGMEASRRTSPAVLVEQAFAACRTEELGLAARVRNERPNMDWAGLIDGMKALMKRDYMQQITDLRAKKR